MQRNTSLWDDPKLFGCARSISCSECHELYVDDETYASKTRRKKAEDFLVKVLFVLLLPSYYMKELIMFLLYGWREC